MITNSGHIESKVILDVGAVSQPRDQMQGSLHFVPEPMPYALCSLPYAFLRSKRPPNRPGTCQFATILLTDKAVMINRIIRVLRVTCCQYTILVKGLSQKIYFQLGQSR